MGLFRKPERISDAVRGLAYTSMILTIPSLIFSLTFFYGFMSYFISPACIGASWIYHAIIIGAERRGRHTQYPAYSSYPALGVATLLALGWIAALVIASLLMWTETATRRDRAPYAFATLEYICIVGHAGVMWALVFFAMRGRRHASGKEPTAAVELGNSHQSEEV